jgi:hypothetical protein
MQKLSEHATVGVAARLTGVKRTTLQSAVGRGEVDLRLLAGGTVVVRIADVEKWRDAAGDRSPGRKARHE